MNNAKWMIMVVALFIILLPVLSLAGTVDLPVTGQTMSYATGDDGHLQMGVQWPEPRFTDNGDGTVTDNLTGLIWLKNANCFGSELWADALTDCNNLAHGSCGLTDGSSAGDWRLPNVNELESLANAEEPTTHIWLNGQGFTNVQGSHYWSSTKFANFPTRAWQIFMPYGDIYYWGYTVDKISFVWPIRSRQEGNPAPSYPANLWQTGQTRSYRTGDDGHLQMGVQWPEPRFTDNGDGTVTDNLTGLIWTQNANLAGGSKTWQDALTYVLMMNAGIYENFGHRDWRLPNRKELYSLTDFSQASPALRSGHPFTNVQKDYWSSTTFALSPAEKAWHLSMYYGYTDYHFSKTSSDFCSVWPVRTKVIELCDGDFDTDGDVDGSDLAVFAADLTGLILADFAADFGRTDCPLFQ
jgi:hypothetical protein